MKYVWITLAALLAILIALFYCFGYDLSPVVTDEAFAAAALFNERAFGMVLVFCLVPLWYLADIFRAYSKLLLGRTETQRLDNAKTQQHHNHYQVGERYKRI